MLSWRSVVVARGGRATVVAMVVAWAALVVAAPRSHAAGSVPGPPIAVVASRADRAAWVGWLPPLQAGGSPITSYTVTASPGGASCFWSSGPLTCLVEGLVNGAAYTFTVHATNGEGPGPESLPTAPVVPLVFFDVPPSLPFAGDIAWLVDAGVASGYPDGSFRPAAGVSRQAMAAFLYRDAGSPRGEVPPCPSAPFLDVGPGVPFCGEIQWLVDAQIATGYPDGAFRTTTPVSRQAMAAFLVRLADPPGGPPACTSAPFVDVPPNSPFCPAIVWLVARGVVAGYQDGTYQPLSPVTRQAMAAFLHRLDALGH